MAARGSGKLKVTLPSDTEILFERVFDAPRHLVFDAMTTPEHVARWWCCMEGYTMTACEIDLRVGGTWRFSMTGPHGEVTFYGEYREIARPDRLVHTEIFAPFPEATSTITSTFEERGGKTYFRAVQRHLNKANRDAEIASGMESGADLAYDRLEEVARSQL